MALVFISKIMLFNKEIFFLILLPFINASKSCNFITIPVYHITLGIVILH